MSSGKYRKEHNCLNCGTHVEKHYCTNCGQPNLELKENFWAFISHSIAHYFHFDNKFFSTLKTLIIEPGKVTLDYLAGRRARYINPVSMYIFVSIIYFLIVPKANHSKKEEKEQVTKQTEKLDSINTDLEKGSKNTKILKGVTQYLKPALIKSRFKQLSFQEQEIEIKRLQTLNDSLKSDSIANVISIYEKAHILKQDSTYAAYLARQNQLPEDERDDWIDRMVKKRDIVMQQKAEHENWSLNEQLEHYRPKQFFLLMPLLALFIMWNFRKNRIYYLDHLIFTIHGMTAFFVVQIFSVSIRYYIFGLDSIASSVIKLAVILGGIWYLYTGLIRFYQRSRKATIRKMITIFFLVIFAYAISEWAIQQFIYYFLL
ncbi:DUF3667 domain-containing protein [Pedobacter sp. MW01-1-1]|uniref:DUF3667 domain-containing protein n=1 Tax=Pedobacter sp. MW01-1-1 TaxID=3383027 RepID=UPI003FF1128F